MRNKLLQASIPVNIKDLNKKLNREWGQWKRRNLSKKEKENLSLSMWTEFMIIKGHKDLLDWK